LYFKIGLQINQPNGNPASTYFGKKLFFLLGFMGSGKTYWGQRWAKQLGLNFYDLDEAIVQVSGKSVATLFEKEGEAYFRELETKTLHGFANFDNCFIACGGGTPCFNDNLDWMNERGTTVYLKASPTEILNRVSAQKEHRPLISKFNGAELLFFIEQKLKEREPFYSRAKITIDINQISAYQFAGL
jgi:shikimate kinase